MRLTTLLLLGCVVVSLHGTAAAGVPDDASTIRAAALKALEAMYGVDLNAAKQLMVSDYPEQGWRVLEYDMKRRIAVRRLAEEIRKQYKKPGETYTANFENADKDHFATEKDEINRGDIVVHGTEAEIDTPAKGPPPYGYYFKLRKVGAEWKLLNPYHFAADVDPEAIWKSKAAELALLDQMAEKVRGGKYASLDAVDQDVYEWTYGAERRRGAIVLRRRRIDNRTGERESTQIIGPSPQ